MHDNILRVDELELDQPIYRIFSQRYFEELVQGKNGLVLPSKWEDPFENFFLKCEAVTSSGERVSLHSIANSWYGQCWTKNRDSDAMWRIYSPAPTRNGIRVKTTIRKLFQGFEAKGARYSSLSYFVGTVSYHARSEIEEFLDTTSFTELSLGGQGTKFAETLLMKRESFDHEREVRLLYHDAELKHVGKTAVNFDFDFHAMIEEVALDPRLDETSFSAAAGAVESLGVTCPIIQSDLYKITPKRIRL